MDRDKTIISKKVFKFYSDFLCQDESDSRRSKTASLSEIELRDYLYACSASIMSIKINMEEESLQDIDTVRLAKGRKIRERVGPRHFQYDKFANLSDVQLEKLVEDHISSADVPSWKRLLKDSTVC